MTDRASLLQPRQQPAAPDCSGAFVDTFGRRRLTSGSGALGAPGAKDGVADDLSDYDLCDSLPHRRHARCEPEVRLLGLCLRLDAVHASGRGDPGLRLRQAAEAPLSRAAALLAFSSVPPVPPSAQPPRRCVVTRVSPIA